MKKILIYIIGIMGLSACSEELNYEMPDNVSDYVQFSVGQVMSGETAASRATADPGNSNTNPGHSVTYDPSKHPNTLGVYAYYDNEVNKVTVTTKGQSTTTWDSGLYWPNLSDKDVVDFVGYMCDASLPNEAKMEKTTEGYDLSFPVTLETPVLVDNAKVDKAPLVCCVPYSVTKKVETIKFDMDRTLTGYSVWFQLGDKMDEVRDFKVKSVNISGTAPKSGKVTCKYTKKSDGAWEKQIEWSVLESSATEFDRNIDWSNMPSGGLLVGKGSTSYVKWGDESPTSQAFFVIPNKSFNPMITVTYDVVLNDPNGSVVTRKNVVSKIQLNSTNFGSYLTSGATGKINPIKIKIVPSYLYVLADQDQASGYIVLQ